MLRASEALSDSPLKERFNSPIEVLAGEPSSCGTQTDDGLPAGRCPSSAGKNQQIRIIASNLPSD